MEAEVKTSLDELVTKMNIEREKILKEREEANRKKQEEEYNETIEKIFKAVSAGKSDRACRILREFAEKEGARIAMTINITRPKARVYGGRPSQTIFF